VVERVGSTLKFSRTARSILHREISLGTFLDCEGQSPYQRSCIDLPLSRLESAPVRPCAKSVKPHLVRMGADGGGQVRFLNGGGLFLTFKRDAEGRVTILVGKCTREVSYSDASGGTSCRDENDRQ